MARLRRPGLAHPTMPHPGMPRPAMPRRAMPRRLALALLAPAAAAQGADPADVSSLDAILDAYYEVVSGPAGQPRDWARDSTLHHPDAVVTVVRTGADGETVIEPVDLAAYHAGAGGLAEAGFFEVEIARQVQQHGAVAHVWSTYESRLDPDEEPFARGINSMQLFWDGERWHMLTIFWHQESEDTPIPAPYLPEGS